MWKNCLPWGIANNLLISMIFPKILMYVESFSVFEHCNVFENINLIAHNKQCVLVSTGKNNLLPINIIFNLRNPICIKYLESAYIMHLLFLKPD